jgi:hypothetical protein
VPDVVAKTNRFGQVLVEAQPRSHGSSDLGYLQSVRQAGDEVVTFGVDEDLGLVFEAAERFGMQDAIAVALKGGAELVVLLRFCPTGAVGGLGCGGS